MTTAGVSQNEAGGRRATWTGSPKGALVGASESNALQFAAATSRSTLPLQLLDLARR